ncbi:MAG: hypothetical protein ABEI97_04040, partial [Candidatus Nanohaloarchaea archaeon]
ETRLQIDAFGLRNAPAAKDTATFVRHHYINDSINWSTYEASYDLGQSGGGGTWTENSMPSISEIKQNWRSRTADQIETYFTGSFPEEKTRCKIGFPGVVVENPEEVEQDDTFGTVYNVDATGDIKVSCATLTANTTVTVNVPPNRRFAPHLRYFSLYRNMTEVIPELDETVANHKQTYSGSGSDCGSASEAADDARDDAESSAESAMKSSIRDVFDAFRPPSSGTNQHGTLAGRYGFSTTDITVDTTSTVTNGPNAVGDCDCETVGTPPNTRQVCDTDYSADAEATIQDATVTVGIENRGYEIPTSDGYTYLEFLVEDVTFSVE